MKRTLVAMAALAASGFAMAQSSVTLFGIVDAGVGSIQAKGAGRATGLINGGINSPRLGFRGTEDLGGGLAASFWLEGTLNNDVGAGASQTTGLDFARRSTVSLSSNSLGEIRLGRDFTATYPLAFTYDVSGNRGLGEIEMFGPTRSGTSTVNAYRTSNSISYFLPATLGGFTGMLQYAFSERASTTTAVTTASGLSSSATDAATKKSGSYIGGRIGYVKGPLNVGAGYGQYADAVRTVGTNSYTADYKIANLGGSYDFGIVKPMAFFQSDKIGGAAGIDAYHLNTYSVGATVPVGAGIIRTQASFYDLKNSSGDSNKVSIGYVYYLSKRTQLYAEMARLNNKSSAQYNLPDLAGLTAYPTPVTGGSSTGYVVGISHTF